MELDHLTLGDTPEEYIENDDGSVEIPGLSAINPNSEEFLTNLAEGMNSKDLEMLGSDLFELVDRDKESRKKRDKQYEEGIRRTGLGDDAPGGAKFAGASKVVHPVLAEACVDFSSRAIKELFPSAGPVKSWIQGEQTPQKTEKANRKTKYMNWQLTTQIEEYKSELEQLLTQLPLGGSQYQKFWYDENSGRICTEFVPIDEVFLPFSATNFYTSARMTHRIQLTKAEFDKRVRTGLYREIDLISVHQYPDESASEQATDKVEGREQDGFNEDGLRAILEIYCWRELEEDDLAKREHAPYIISVDESTKTVLSIYRNWDEADPRRRKLDWFVEWKFIPWRGAYAIGLPHLIGGLSAALTGALRALLDSAHINNAATMLKLKAGRVVGQNTSVDVTQVCEIDGPASIDDIRKIAMPMPFNPPSPVLAGLMESLYALAKGVVATADDKLNSVGDRTPVGTTMALIEQGSHTYSSIHARLHESQKRALSIIHRLNGIYLDEENLLEDLGEAIVDREDFQGPMDVIPVSDPTIFSEAQRFAQTQAIMQMAQADAQNPNIPWNQVNVRRRMLKQMRIENIDELLPPVKDPITDSILIENAQVLKGFPIKSGMDQDHMSHIQGHMAFLSSPLQLNNPLVPVQALGVLLSHVEEHIQDLAMVMTSQAVQWISTTQMIPPEKAMAQATQTVQQSLAQTLQPVMQQVMQVQQVMQQRTPPPPMPPEVQASIKIAEMDINRKAQMDKATLEQNNAREQSKQQAEMAKFQSDQARLQFEQGLQKARQQFDQYMTVMRTQQEDQIAQLQTKVDLMINVADNRQKQMTELLKNRDDNETKVLIEKIKAQLATAQESLRQEGAEGERNSLAPQLQQMQQLLEELGENKTEDALSSVLEELRATMESLNVKGKSNE